MHRRGIIAVGAALCAALAGCGTSGGAEAGAETLAEFMGWEGGDDAESQARWAEEERQREEQIAACMAEEGWDYIPVDHSQFQGGGPAEDIPEDPDAFRERFGYGITTMDDIWEQQQPETEFRDPNEDYVESLSDAEREAYYEALHGVVDEANPTEDPATGDEYFVPEGGCQNEVWNQDQQQDMWEELGPMMDELYERIESDPRLVEATAKWSACMQEAGYTFATLGAPIEHLIEKSNEMWESQADPFEGMSGDEIQEFLETTTEEEQNELFGPDPQVKAELQEEEMAIATADGQCRAEHVGDLEEEVRKDLEAEFLRDNRELLEKVRDAEAAG